jgi:hypothetical protein
MVQLRHCAFWSEVDRRRGCFPPTFCFLTSKCAEREEPSSPSLLTLDHHQGVLCQSIEDHQHRKKEAGDFPLLGVHLTERLYRVCYQKRLPVPPIGGSRVHTRCNHVFGTPRSGGRHLSGERGRLLADQAERRQGCDHGVEPVCVDGANRYTALQPLPPQAAPPEVVVQVVVVVG